MRVRFLCRRHVVICWPANRCLVVGRLSVSLAAQAPVSALDGLVTDTSRAARGLLCIHERVRLVGGTVDVVTQPTQGTTIRAWIPIQHDGVMNVSRESEL
jgi:hypothetical protein